MSGWESYASCMEARSVEAGQVVRGIALTAFHGATDKAEAFCKAAYDWWYGLDEHVRTVTGWGLAAGGAVAGILATRLAAVIITESAVALLAGAGAEVALALTVMAGAMAVGAFMTASGGCLGFISI